MEPEKKVSICGLCAHTPICKNQPQQSCPYLQLKDKKPAEPKTPVKPQKSFWRTLLTIALCVLVVVLMGASFYVGRLSMYPRFISFVPKISHPLKPSVSPEEVVRQFFKAAQEGNEKQVLALCHPEFLNNNKQDVVEFIEDSPRDLNLLKEIKFITRDDMVRVYLTLTGTRGNIDSGSLWLKQYQGEWRMFDLNPL